MLEKELSLAVEAAEAAGSFLRSGRTGVQVESQAGRDIKLAQDRQSEEIILGVLAPSGLPVLSEERGMVGDAQGGRYWIVDPLDGTANYWKGMQELSCVSVALWESGAPVLGAICRFRQGELFAGAIGEGAWLNRAPIHTSDVAQLGQAVLATGLPLHMPQDDGTLAGMAGTMRLFKKVRMLGAAALMGAFVAAGRADAYMEEHIMLWDIAAAAAIVEAAGGVADIQPLGDAQCVCRLFANRALREAYRSAKGEVA